MSGRVGADPESLDDLASQLRGFKDTLHSTSRHLTSGVHERAWKGARADRFRSDWDHLYVPWINGACDWLDHAVTALHDNANQQRVASGDKPKDYSTGFTHLVHRAEHGVDRLAHDVHDWSIDAWNAGRDVVGSKAFDEVLGGLQVVSTVAGIVALVPIPVVQEVAGGVAVATGAAVLVGHVLQNANRGTFNAKQFATDSLGVAGGGLGRMSRAASKSVTDATRVMGEESYFAGNARDIEHVWKTFGSANLLTRDGIQTVKDAWALDTKVDQMYKVAQVSQIPVRVGNAATTAWSTEQTVHSDLSHGDYGKAVHDLGVGSAKVVGGLSHNTALNNAIKAEQTAEKGAAYVQHQHGGGDR